MGIKQGLLSFAAVTGVSALAARATRRQLRILCYHGLWVTPSYQFGNCLFMPPDQFDARMARRTPPQARGAFGSAWFYDPAIHK